MTEGQLGVIEPPVLVQMSIQERIAWMDRMRARLRWMSRAPFGGPRSLYASTRGFLAMLVAMIVWYLLFSEHGHPNIVLLTGLAGLPAYVIAWFRSPYRTNGDFLAPHFARYQPVVQIGFTALEDHYTATGDVPLEDVWTWLDEEHAAVLKTFECKSQ